MARTQAATEPEPKKDAPKEPGKADTPAAQAIEKAETATYWEQLAAFPDAEWDSNLLAYLYRCAPFTDRSKSGQKNYIRRYSRCFDIDQVKADEGSGEYRIDLTKRDPVKGGTRRIMQFYFDIMDPDYPPRIPAGEWIDDPRNEKWNWAKAKIQQASAVAGFYPAPQQADPSQMLKTVGELYQKLNPGGAQKDGTAALMTAVVAMIQSNQEHMMKMADPTKQLALVESLVSKIIPKPTEDKGVERMFTMLMEDRKAMRDEIKELRNQPKPKGLLEEIKEMKEGFTALKEVFGGRSERKAPSDWMDVLMTVTDKVIDAASPIVEHLFMGGGAGATPAAGWAPKTTAVAKRENSPDGEEPAEGAEPAAATTDSEHDKRLAYLINKYGGLLQQCAPFMMDEFAAGGTGYDFRDWFIHRKGNEAYTMISAEMNPDILVEILLRHPQVGAALKPAEAKLHTFFEEFFTAPVDDEPDEEEDDDPPPPRPRVIDHQPAPATA